MYLSLLLRLLLLILLLKINADRERCGDDPYELYCISTYVRRVASPRTTGIGNSRDGYYVTAPACMHAISRCATTDAAKFAAAASQSSQ
jgi:hypothetical protein